MAPPAPDTGEFLGVWELFSDTGELSAPLCLGLLSSSVGLHGSAVFAGAVGFIGFFWYLAMVPETLKRVVRIESAQTT
jgi:hypothetical protein